MNKGLLLIVLIGVLLLNVSKVSANITGDINNDGNINLDDSVLALKVMTISTSLVPVFKIADINNDGQIGIEEAIYALQVTSGLKLPTTISTISGTVSGTMLLAVNKNGEVVASDDTSGREKDIDLDGDGQEDSYSFTLTGIPANTAIRIYLISNGQIYPLYFDPSGGIGSPATNVLFASTGLSIYLGAIDLSEHEYTGKAIAQINPAATANVSAGTEDQNIPNEIITPPTAGLSVTELIDAGFDAGVNGAALMARTYFAAALANSSPQTNLGDTARFFYAVSRVAAVAYETYSDGNSADLNQVGDFLDRGGVDSGGTTRSNFEAIAVKIDEIVTWPSNSPTGTDVQNFIRNTLKAEIEGAIGNLNEVSNAFTWNEVLPDNSPIEFDYADSLAVRAALKTLLAILQFQDSYDLGADIDAVANNQSSTIESFLLDNQNFLTLGNSQLDSVKANTRSALVDIDSAITEIQGETDPQEDDLLSFIDVLPEDVTAFQADIISAINNLDSGSVVATLGELDMSPPPGAPPEITVDLYGLFSGINLRSKLPAFNGDRPGFFPDVTLGGLVVGGTEYLNYDVFNDGKPDILQRNKITNQWNIEGNFTLINQ